jgi:hypothetical protein
LPVFAGINIGTCKMSKTGLVAGVFDRALIFPLIKSPAVTGKNALSPADLRQPKPSRLAEHPGAPLVPIIPKGD